MNSNAINVNSPLYCGVAYFDSDGMHDFERKWASRQLSPTHVGHLTVWTVSSIPFVFYCKKFRKRRISARTFTVCSAHLHVVRIWSVEQNLLDAVRSSELQTRTLRVNREILEIFFLFEFSLHAAKTCEVHM